MRILHTADLHIGKMVNNFSMIEDQKHILKQMVDAVKAQQADAFIIAGDVYDRPIPSAEAVEVFHDFIQKLHETGVEIFCISGNHDSPERLSFAEEILGEHGVHFAGTYKEKCKQITLQDPDGPVVFTLMPFVKAAVLGENTSEEAVSHMLADTFRGECDTAQDRKLPEGLEKCDHRHILVTHYFVTNAGRTPELSDSENPVSVGGLDNVDASCFKGFAYTALGHIHKPQQMNKEGDSLGPVVYAGTPLAYSFSECGQEKSLVQIDMDKEGNVQLQRLELKPLHRMRKVKGRLEEVISPAVCECFDKEDYLQVTLTDEDELIDPIGTLRSVYPNVMQLLFDKKEKESDGEYSVTEMVEKKTTEELFEDFYYLIREKEMDDARKSVIRDVIKELA